LRSFGRCSENSTTNHSAKSFEWSAKPTQEDNISDTIMFDDDAEIISIEEGSEEQRNQFQEIP
jgi:hypothetical protein